MATASTWQTDGELARLVAEQRLDARAESEGKLWMPKRGVQSSGNEAPAELVARIDGSDLGERERHVIRERLSGRSFAAIARDGAMGGVSRQRVQMIEAEAMRRFDPDLRSVEAWLARSRVSQAWAMRERGRLVLPLELHAVSEN